MRSFAFLILVLPGAALKLKDKDEPEGYMCKKFDGFGAQLQCKFAAFAKARYEKKCYFHASFSGGMHSNSKDIDFDGLLGLKSDKGCKEKTTENVRGWWHKKTGEMEKNPDQYYTPEVRAELRRMYEAAPSKKPKLEDCEVAIHMRKPGNNGAYDRADHQWHHMWRWSSNAAIYEVITTKFNDKKVCVFSEGVPEDFGEIAKLDNTKLLLNGEADYPFHNFVRAPELVISKSSLSFTAALLNQGKVYYLDKFWHKTLQHWEQIITKTDYSKDWQAPFVENAVARKVHLLSFRSCSQDEKAPCNQKHFKQMDALAEMASNVNLSQVITDKHLYRTIPDQIYKDPKWAKHLAEKEDHTSAVRGRGYWFWKVALFNHLLNDETIKDGDIVVYADPDSHLFLDNPHAAEMFRNRLALFSDAGDSPGKLDIFVEAQPKSTIKHAIIGDEAMHNKRYLRGEKDLCEFSWTKNDIFEKFGTTWDNPQYGMTSQAHGSFFITSVNARTRKFMKMHEENMADFHLCSDEESVSPNNPHFAENRHDQSLFSMLIKAQAPSISDNGASAVCRKQVLGSADAIPNDWKKHPTFGVEGLTAHIGHFPALPRDMHKVLSEKSEAHLA